MIKTTENLALTEKGVELLKKYNLVDEYNAHVDKINSIEDIAKVAVADAFADNSFEDGWYKLEIIKDIRRNKAPHIQAIIELISNAMDIDRKPLEFRWLSDYIA